MLAFGGEDNSLTRHSVLQKLSVSVSDVSYIHLSHKRSHSISCRMEYSPRAPTGEDARLVQTAGRLLEWAAPEYVVEGHPVRLKKQEYAEKQARQTLCVVVEKY